MKIHVRKFFGTEIDSLQRIFGRKDKTFAGEFHSLSNILSSIGSPKNFNFVDIGAGDGFNMSVAFPLMKYFDANGLLIEPDEYQLNKAKKLYKNRSGFGFSSEFLTPNNAIETLGHAGFPNPLYIKVDIDSFDLDVIRSLLAHKIRPKIFSIEVNELMPPPVRFEVRYTEGISDIKHPLVGCSLQSAYDLAKSHGYFLHSLAFNNAFFVSDEYLALAFSVSEKSPEDAFEEGFLSREWQKLFPGDIKFRDWFMISPRDLVQIIRELPEFDKRCMEAS